MAKPYNCTSCNHFYPVPKTNGGQCRRYPPTAVMLCVGQRVIVNPLTRQQDTEPLVHSQALWPGVGPSDYCGEHPMAAKALPILGEAEPLSWRTNPPTPIADLPPPTPAPAIDLPSTVSNDIDIPAILDEPKGKA